jgi:hypothetical protein
MITVDPAPPIWSMGMQNLYSKEFFELGKEHLTDGGIMMMWTPSESVNDFLMILRAFVDVFPYVEVFQGLEYDDAHYLLGSRSPIAFDEALVRERLAAPAVRADIDELTPGMFSFEALASMHRIGGDAARALVAHVEPLTDDHPRLEFQNLRPAPSGERVYFGVPPKLRTPLPLRPAQAKEPTTPTIPAQPKQTTTPTTPTPTTP